MRESDDGTSSTRWGALWYWAPLVVWLVAIFYFSSDALSSEHTSHFVEPLIRALFPHASDAAVYGLHVAVRKCGHVTEYALLALLAFRAVRAGRDGVRVGWAWAAFGIAAMYALVDEFHQTFVRSRTGNLHDAVIDMTGAAAALIFLVWASRRRGAVRRRAVVGP
jgi:VanZ family protein